MHPSAQLEVVTQGYLAALNKERDGFLALHGELLTAHPTWVAGKDARLGLVAKPINLILSACVNMRLTQRVLAFPQWWATNVAPELGSEEAIEGAMFDVQTFYRFGFFQFLSSNVEHGLRAIQPVVVTGADSQADTAYWRVYTTLFRAALPEDLAARHINVFAFLSTLRNTIHNNGVYSPHNHRDASFVIGDREYQFRDGHPVEAFGWDRIIAYLPHIREALTDLMRSPQVSSIPEIADIASTPLSGLAPTRGSA
ncbi:MAG: hypothetical protein ABIP09_07910 [Gemmatimonadaceae bacterium]